MEEEDKVTLGKDWRKQKAFQSCRSVKSFKILNQIDEGTYGVVSRAEDLETGEIVALKKIKILKSEVNGFPITSLREIKLLMEHKHPNILEVKEIVYGKSYGVIYIVMEFLEHDLKVLMENMKGQFLQNEVKCLLQQLLRGVNYLHSNWILHRDLKTSNLLLNNKGILKIADFGLAREYGSPLHALSPSVVTLWYRSPELLLGIKEYTTAIDIWSVGCIFGELIRKEALFPGEGEINQITLIFSTLGTPTEEEWPGLNELPGVKQFTFKKYPQNKLREKFPMITSNAFDLLSKMLTYDPKQRITAQEALDHPYFTEKPLPTHPSMMPTFPSKAEGGVSKKRTYEDYLQGKESSDSGLLGNSVYGSFAEFQLKFGNQ